MGELVKVNGFATLRKDKATGGIVNVDTDSYTAYVQSRKLALRNQKEKEELQTSLSDVQGQINNMNNEISEIKELLMILIQKDKQ